MSLFCGWWAVFVGATACVPAPVSLTVPVTGAVAAVAGLRVTVRLERHKHGQGFTLGYYEVRVQDGALDERHTMEVVRDEDWFGELPLGAGRVVQLLGVDARGAVRVRIVSSTGKPPARDALLDAELPPTARALRPPGASRGNRSLHTQNGTLVVTESGGKGQPSVRVVFGELTGHVLDARRWKPTQD